MVAITNNNTKSHFLAICTISYIWKTRTAKRMEIDIAHHDFIMVSEANIQHINKKLSYRRETARQLPTCRGQALQPTPLRPL